MHLVLIPTAEDYSTVLRALFLLFLVIPNYSLVISISEWSLGRTRLKKNIYKMNYLRYFTRYVFKTSKYIFNY